MPLNEKWKEPSVIIDLVRLLLTIGIVIGGAVMFYKYEKKKNEVELANIEHISPQIDIEFEKTLLEVDEKKNKKLYYVQPKMTLTNIGKQNLDIVLFVRQVLLGKLEEIPDRDIISINSSNSNDNKCHNELLISWTLEFSTVFRKKEYIGNQEMDNFLANLIKTGVKESAIRDYCPFFNMAKGQKELSNADFLVWASDNYWIGVRYIFWADNGNGSFSRIVRRDRMPISAMKDKQQSIKSVKTIN